MQRVSLFLCVANAQSWVVPVCALGAMCQRGAASCMQPYATSSSCLPPSMLMQQQHRRAADAAHVHACRALARAICAAGRLQ